jgi:hypothetical protein
MNNEKMIDDAVLDEALDKLASVGVIDDDLDLTIPASSTRDRWASWLDILGWKSTDGPAEGVWDRRGQGHKSLWTCTWITSTGVIGPDQLLPLDSATDEQLLAELEDRLFQSKWGYLPVRSFADEQRAEELITKFTATKDENTKYWVKDFLSHNRGYPVEYFCAWDPPPNIRYRYDRPGWPTENNLPKEEESQPTEPEKPPEGKGETIYF